MSTASNSTVESTGISGRLEQMVELLCSEEEERNPTDPGTMVRTHLHSLVYECVCVSTAQCIPVLCCIHDIVCVPTGSMYGMCVEVQTTEHARYHSTRRCKFIRLLRAYTLTWPP